MKHIVKNITSVLMAFLVLISTFSFTVEKHYCGDFLVDVSFTGNAKECNMEEGSADVVKMKKCCKNEITQIKGQDELQQYSLDEITFENQQFLTAFVISKKNLFNNYEVKKSVPQYYFPPPNIERDYQVLFQSFLCNNYWKY